jgi:hypothetical protein
MSTYDSHSGKPEAGPQEINLQKKEKTTPTPPAERAEGDSFSRRRRHVPALRLAAWMLGLVIVLGILGWALSGVL